MKRIIAIVLSCFWAGQTGFAQSNPANSCVADSITNCTSDSGVPFVITTVSEPSDGWPYTCVGTELSMSAAPSTNLPGLAEIITTNEDCSITDTILLPSDAIISTSWVATGEPFGGSGLGSNAVFTPTNCGTGTLIFSMTYLEQSPCGTGTNTVAMTNTYSVIGAYSLAPTTPTNFYMVESNAATLQIFNIPVSTNPAITNLQFCAQSCPSSSPTNLPECWLLDGVRTNTATIPITQPGIFTVVFTVGTSAITNVVCVTNSTGDVEQSCGTNGPVLLGYWSFNNSLIDSWPGNGNANDIIGTNNGTINGDVYFASGPWGDAFDFQPAFPDGNATITFDTNVGNFSTNNFAVDFFIRIPAFNGTFIPEPTTIMGKGAVFEIGVLANGTINLALANNDGTEVVSLRTLEQVNDGNFHEVTVMRNSGTLSLYIDGVVDAATNVTTIADLQNSNMMTWGVGHNGINFVGMLQNVTFSLGTPGPWVGNFDQQPLASYGLQNPPSPWGDALQVDSTNVAYLTYPYMQNNGAANINCINGAVSFWIKPDWNGGAGPGNVGQLLEMGDAESTNGWWSLSVDATGSTLSFQSESNGVLITYFTQPITNWLANSWYQIVLNYSPLETSLYTNGVLAQIGPGIVNYPTIENRLQYGFSIGSDHDGTDQIHGIIDELATFDCALSSQQIADGYPGPNGNVTPSIITQPVSQTANDGDTISFAVTALGAPSLKYQWSCGGTNIAGATDDIYTMYNVQTSNSGAYIVLVSNSFGATNSAAAILDVQTCHPFTNGSFEIGTNGWLLTGSAAVIQQSTNLAAADGTNYALFTNGGSISQSICIDPGSWYQIKYAYAAVPQGGQTSASLKVEVLAYKQCLFLERPCATTNIWQTNTFQLQAPLDADIITLTFSSETNATSGFSAIDNVSITNLGDVELPFITVQPVSQTNNAGNGSSFVVTATGSGLTYQWQKNGVRLTNGNGIGGATSATLNPDVYGLSKSDDGTYSVIVSNDSGGSIQSWDATLTVLDPVITGQPKSMALELGQINETPLTVNAVGSPSGYCIYQWYKNGNAITDGTGIDAAYWIGTTGTQLGDAGQYYVTVTGTYGTVTSEVASVTILNPQAFITSQPSSQVACLGDTNIFSVSASGNGLSYQWFENGIATSDDSTHQGSASVSYTISGVSTSDFGTYTVQVANYNGTVVTSAPAILYATPSFDEGTIAVGVDYGTIEWFLPDGTPKYILGEPNSGLPVDMCFDSQQDIISVPFNGSSLAINDLCGFSIFDPGSEKYPMFYPMAVAMDASGNTYVGTYGNGIMEFDANQNFVTNYISATPVLAMDLDADQTNLYFIDGYGTSRQIFKLPVGGATGNPTLFSTLTSDGGEPRCLRVLPDGSILVADSLNVKRNNANGTIATWNAVDPTNFNVFSISVDPSGESFWVSDWCVNGVGSGVISNLSLSTGIPTGPGFSSGSTYQFGIGVIGELRMGRLISQQPLNQTVCPGGSATFTVAACQRFPYPLSYAWYMNGNPVSGATNTSFTTTTPGAYKVVLTCTNLPGINVCSAPASLTVGPPTIERQPVGEFLLTGQSAYFNVEAQGAGLSYQWYKNGSPISGATASAYPINSVTTNDAGTYSVTVDSCGISNTTASTQAVLAVREAEPPGFFSGMVDWWPAEGNLTDIIGGQDGDTYSVSPMGFDQGEVKQAFSFYGQGGFAVDSSDSFIYSAGRFGVSDFSIEFWMQSADQQTEELMGYTSEYEPDAEWHIRMMDGQIYVVWNGLPSQLGRSAQWYPTFPFSLISSPSLTVNDGRFHHVVVSRHSLTVSIFIDGEVAAMADAQGVANLFNTDSSYPALTFGAYPGSDPGYYSDLLDVHAFVGKLDEIIFYDRALSEAEVRLAFNEGTYGKLPRLPLVAYDIQFPDAAADDYTPQIQPYVPGHPEAAIYWTTNGSAPTPASNPLESYFVDPSGSGNGVISATPALANLFDNEASSGYSPFYLQAMAVAPNYLNSEASSLFLGINPLMNSPSFIVQPMSQSVEENTSSNATPVVFAGTAVGALPGQYQWWFWGAPISGATAASLSVMPISENAGTYFVVASNAAGMTMSSPVVLTIGKTATIPVGQIISWWPGLIEDNEQTYDVIGGHDGSYGWGTVNFVPGYIGQGFSFTDGGGNLTGGNISVYDNLGVFDLAGPFSITAWVFLFDGRTNFPADNAGYRIVLVKTNQYELDYSVNGLRGVVGTSVCAGRIPLAPNQWHNAAMTYDGTNIDLYLDGVSCGGTNGAAPPAATENNLFLGGDGGVGDILDEIILYNTNLSPQLVTQEARANLGVTSTISITAQPQNQQICAGSGWSESVTATGRSPLSYQWYSNGVPIPNANQAGTYAGGAGTYSVTIYDGLSNSLQSASGVVVVSSNRPVIIAQPQSQYLFPDGMALFSVTATGDNLAYQWQFNSTPIPGETNSFLVIENAQTAQTGSYNVLVQDACDYVYSQQASLALVAGNAVSWGGCGMDSTNNDITSIAAGSGYDLYLRANGSVVASGSDGGSGAASPPSAVTSPTGTNLVVAISAGPAHALALMSDQTVTGWGEGPEANASGRTNVAAISAGYQHSMVLYTNGTVQTWGSAVPSGLPAGLSNVMAIAAGDVHDMALRADGTVLAWGNNDHGVCNIPTNLSNGVAIVAGTNFSMALDDTGLVTVWGDNAHGVCNVPTGLSNVVQIAAGTNYCMALTDDGRVATWGDGANGNPAPPALQAVVAVAGGASCPLAVTVAPILTSQPLSQANDPGDSLTFSVTALNSASATYLNYQWQLNGTNIPGANSSSLLITSVIGSQMGIYTVLVANDYATTPSDPAILIVSNSPPVVVSPSAPINRAKPQGSSTTFSVSAIGTGILKYQWELNGVPITNATSTNYTISSAQASSAGDYRVLVTNSYGSAWSADMRLVVQPQFAIAQQPVNQTVAAGGSVVFKVGTIGGVPPLSYQWVFTNSEGSNTIGTDATFETNHVTFSDEGNIYVVVTDADGNQITSQEATLTIIPIWTWAPSGLVAWWKGESNALDSVGTNNAIAGDVSYVPGVVGNAFYFDGVSDGLEMADSPSLALTNTSFTLEGWINILTDEDVGYPVNSGWVMERGNSNIAAYGLYLTPDPMGQYAATLTFQIQSADGTAAVAECDVPEDQWTHIAAVFDANAQTMTLYVNGQIGNPEWGFTGFDLFPLNPIDGITNLPSDSLTNAEVLCGDFSGMLDELTVYTNALTQDYVQSIYNAYDQGKFVPAISMPSLSNNENLPPSGNNGSTITVPVVISGPLGTIQDVVLYCDGLPCAGAAVLYPPFTSDQIAFTLDTAFISNGSHQLYAEVTWTSEAPVSDDGSPCQADSAGVPVTITNEISYPDWVAPFGETGNSLLVHATSAHSTTAWNLDIYDSQSNYVVSINGATTNGDIYVNWNLEDANGVIHNDDLFYFYLTTDYIDPPLFLAYKVTDPWPFCGGWVVANQQAWNTFLNHEDLDAEADGWVAFVLQFNAQRLNTHDQDPINLSSGAGSFPIRTEDQGVGVPDPDWVALRHALFGGTGAATDNGPFPVASDINTSRNFFFLGHGNPKGIGADSRKTSQYISVNEIINKLRSGATNAHKYRFVCLDGCETASGRLPQAFAPLNMGSKTRLDFAYASLRPSAFCGWDTKVPAGYGLNNGNIDERHVTFMNNFLIRWTDGSTLTQARAYANAYGNYDTPQHFRILGFGDLGIEDYNNYTQ